METKTILADSDGPLTEHHYRELARARDRARPIRRAARVAAFNSWTIAAIAILSLPFAIFGFDGLLVAAGLLIIAYLEARGRGKLLQFEPSAASWLGWNQIGLLTLIIVYCLWMMFSGATNIQANPELSQLLGANGLNLYRSMVKGFYGTVIALSVIFQGSNALYYFTRRKKVVDYLQQTPRWVQDFQRIMNDL